MTVVGVGVDLVHVPTFADQLELPGSTIFGVFTPGERRVAPDHPQSLRGAGPARHLAARWAAKEATIKAWSASMHGHPPVVEEGIHHLIEVVRDAWGRPRLVVHGVVAEALGRHDLHVSLSHDGDYATSFVVLSVGDEVVSSRRR